MTVELSDKFLFYLVAREKEKQTKIHMTKPQTCTWEKPYQLLKQPYLGAKTFKCYTTELNLNIKMFSAFYLS